MLARVAAQFGLSFGAEAVVPANYTSRRTGEDAFGHVNEESIRLDPAGL